MRDVDVHWIVHQMIGSDAKDFATPGDHGFGGEALRADDICLPRITGGYAVDHVSLTVRAGRDRWRLRVDGRRTKRVSRMRDGSPSAGVRPPLRRGQACPRTGRRRSHRPRARAHPRGSPTRRARADSVGRRESDDGEPAQADQGLSHSGARRGRRGATRNQGAVDQGRRSQRCRSRRCRAEISRRW